MTNDKIIRTLGLYQPFAGLMLPPYNKIETRWVANGRKPPFPLGKYLLYSTKRVYTREEFLAISAEYGLAVDTERIKFKLTGKALCIGDLVRVEKMTKEHQEKAFVAHHDPTDTHTRWCLIFENVKAIDPFTFSGKQGIGFLSEQDKEKIKFL